MSDLSVKIEVVEGDVLKFAADVLALKYAGHYYGSDAAVSTFLVDKGAATQDSLKPNPGEHAWVNSHRVLSSKRVLFVGVPPLIRFGYAEIEEWVSQVLSITEREFPYAAHIAITLHGPGYGLDEIEALHAELRGIDRAIESGDVPRDLRMISIVERYLARVDRLNAALAEVLPPANRVRPAGTPVPRLVHRRTFKLPRVHVAEEPETEELNSATEELPSAEQVEHKPRAFVAMPFSPEMEDVFYYGIQNPVRQLGYICERVDQEAFTGDILDQVKMRIENAEIVFADLTGANPNVYLEVGYAWGRGRPTVLVANKNDELRFDVRGQRCLKYQSIKDLEKTLTDELKSLGTKRAGT